MYWKSNFFISIISVWSLAVSAAAQGLPQLDYVDLTDGFQQVGEFANPYDLANALNLIPQTQDVQAGSSGFRVVWSDGLWKLGKCPPDITRYICGGDPVPEPVVCPDGGSYPCKTFPPILVPNTPEPGESIAQYFDVNSNVLAMGVNGLEVANGASVSSSRGFYNSFIRNKDPLSNVVALVDGLNSVICSGALVANDLVLTASHCFCKAKPIGIWIGRQPGITPENGVGFNLKAIYNDEGNPEFLKKDFCLVEEELRKLMPDLALLRIESSIVFHQSYISTLATSDEWSIAEEYWFSGFGVNSKDFKDHSKLSGFGEGGPCSEPDTATGCTVGRDIIVRPTAESKQDTCAGDSGGPLYYKDKVVAVSRSGLADSKDGFCGQGGIYTNLSGKLYREEITKWLLEYGITPYQQ